jgi:hypothetical protein
MVDKMIGVSALLTMTEGLSTSVDTKKINGLRIKVVHSGGLTRDTLWGVSALQAHRFAARAKLAGAS